MELRRRRKYNLSLLRQEYEPSYEDTYIGGESVDCYTEDMKTYTCDKCGKKFTMYGYQVGWKYQTETIDGEATDEEIEEW